MRPTAPGPAADRIDYVDILRGFALIGVFGANLFLFSGLAFMSDAQRALLPTARLDRVVQFLELIFIENKFLGLFAMLFGVSFWLFFEGGRARGESGAGRVSLFYRRLGWLFLIGAVHGWLLWCFDVLRFYALWGLMLPLFLRVSQKALLRVALFFGVLAPAVVIGLRSLLFATPAPDVALDVLALRAFSSGAYLDVLRANWRYDWKLTLSVSQIAYQVAILGRLLLGLWAARAGVVSRLSQHRSLFRTVLLWGSLVGIVCNVLDATHLLDSSPAAPFLLAFASRLVGETGYLSLSLAYACALALLVQRSQGPDRLRALGSVGRMALSLYLFQTVIGLFLFYTFTGGPRLMGRIGPAWLLPIWIGGYGLQLWIASAWLRRHRFGPAEWLWRSLTYWRIQPLRIRR